MRGRTGVILAGMVLYVSVGAAAADARQEYDKLFGREEAKARLQDMPALAGKILEAARSLHGQHDLRVVLCDKAYEHGIKHPGGYETAIEAMRLLGQMDASHGASSRQRILHVCLLRQSQAKGPDKARLAEASLEALLEAARAARDAGQYAESLGHFRRAGEVEASLRTGQAREIALRTRLAQALQQDAMVRQTAENERRLLSARTDDLPSGGAARAKLVRLLLCEFDAAKEASALVTAELDPALRAVAARMLQPVEKLPEQECLELGRWCLEESVRTSNAGKLALLRRAKSCLERYRSLHPAPDVPGVQADLGLREVEEGLVRLGAAYPRGTVLAMSFDEAAVMEKEGKTYVKDLSGNENHALLEGGEWVGGQRGQALLLGDPVTSPAAHRRKAKRPPPAGEGDSLTTVRNVGIQGSRPRSVVFWCKVHAHGKMGAFMGWGSNHTAGQFGVGTYEQYWFLWSYGYGHDWKTASPVDSPRWHHQAVIYDGKTARWFTDGVEAGKGFVHAYQTADTPLRLRGQIWVYAIDELILVNRALGEKEIKLLYEWR